MMPKKLVLLLFCIVIAKYSWAQGVSPIAVREHLLMDFDWRFTFGHPYDTKKDFNNGTGYFSYFAKAGYGDGAAAPGFDDRAWRKLDLPHDWTVELGFSPQASLSHGFKAIGRNFPDVSVGWYRKTFKIPASDLGRQISIAFDGVFRNSIVWINGHYLGTEQSGYNSFEYNISEYLNYGGENVIAVRVDATMEEGWFYEGAGIYRHTWLNKTDPLHIATNGTFVTTKLNDDKALISVNTTINNDGRQTRSFTVLQTIINADGKIIASAQKENITLSAFNTQDVKSILTVTDAKLWSIETPYLHKLLTTIEENGKVIDRYETKFGIRTIRFDANEGFFLNGKHVEIKGTNNHQDFAGVGTAMPDALQDFRISTLKSFGSNAYRCSHNPPTPELLEACDRLGMLVIVENRLMGTSSTQLNDLKKLIIRDRNHPSVISWSIGNEEWAIENNITGARIATTMQAFAKSIDSTRYITAAFSGGIGAGLSNVMDVMGYNYVVNKNTDEHHQKHPGQLSWGTEEGSTVSTRGAYINDTAKHLRAAYDERQNDNSLSIEEGWKHYAARPYLAGMYIWTGFDYRGEPTPFGWPSVESYFGMVDACGFLKDDAWYLKSWWGNQPVVHLLPHWNWAGKEGQVIKVWVHSNCDEVELFLNKKSLGKKVMQANSHLEWQVKYIPGMLEAIGYKNGRKIAGDVVKTTDAPAAIALSANKPSINADREDLAMITVQVNDKNKLRVPIADNDITFSITGPGKIIGVGNGNNTSLEPDRFFERISIAPVNSLKEKIVAEPAKGADFTTAAYDDTNWDKAFKDERDEAFGQKVKSIVYRGSFILPADKDSAAVTFFYKSLGKVQSVYVNGKELGHNLPADEKGNVFKLETSLVHPGINSIAIIAVPFTKKHSWDNINTDPGLVQLVYPPAAWKRKLFNGLAQVIIQSTGQPGEITLTATSARVKKAVLKINALPSANRPAVDSAAE
ncbi:beta-galactosidase GalA [Mucilaginibacter sp.]|uniref:beta-galactosidase GalA n=1 Tax=Mucilaginibacter sp. TaxID=1882438 RepID=UPI003D0C1DB7